VRVFVCVSAQLCVCIRLCMCVSSCLCVVCLVFRAGHVVRLLDIPGRLAIGGAYALAYACTGVHVMNLH
jgi:hypothetical protein